ncbi:hypothetical protein [Actinomadura sp. HBU206391]|uniref:hypothetical protein n=1 Tax=Actinomadura sp. HBU206391 TaxID=2731692 RepID=UPI00164FAE08|nr:hypothetical protein [Actinomadura sp. HBU206391]MBC6459098.1 hypothetical protein [Actinomadura sp. HBU206391]
MNPPTEEPRTQRCGGERLSAEQRLAIDLARDLRHHLGRWLTVRSVVTATLGVSPYIDPAGRASVLVRMDAGAAHTLLCRLIDDGVVLDPPGQHRRHDRAGS